MGDIKLFKLSGSSVTEIDGGTVALERSLQMLFERNLEALIGVRFLASEYTTTNGRIDTLGLDENNCPVIIEYKRASNENVVTQGLYYLDWLMDHRSEFKWLVMEKFEKKTADEVEWSAPRLICVAGDYNKYDEYAIKQMNRNIELIRYAKYGEDLLLLDLITATGAKETPLVATGAAGEPGYYVRTIDDAFAVADRALLDRYEALKAYLVALGDDVQVRTLKHYVAFKRIKNFACVELKTSGNKVVAFVKVDPASITLVPGFTRDVSKLGHFGTGDLEISIASDGDFERAKPLLLQSYEAS